MGAQGGLWVLGGLMGAEGGLWALRGDYGCWGGVISAEGGLWVLGGRCPPTGTHLEPKQGIRAGNGDTAAPHPPHTPHPTPPQPQSRPRPCRVRMRRRRMRRRRRGAVSTVYSLFRLFGTRGAHDNTTHAAPRAALRRSYGGAGAPPGLPSCPPTRPGAPQTLGLAWPGRSSPPGRGQLSQASPSSAWGCRPRPSWRLPLGGWGGSGV